MTSDFGDRFKARVEKTGKSLSHLSLDEVLPPSTKALDRRPDPTGDLAAAIKDYNNDKEESRVEDLSHLAGDIGTALVGGQSQAAGNTVNHPNGTMGAPGSTPVNSPAAVVELDHPEVEVPPVTDYVQRP